MHTRQCKRILKGLKKMTNNSGEPFTFSEATGNGCDFYCQATKNTYDYSRDKHEIDVVLKFMEQQGYLESDESGSIICYRITYAGLHSSEIAWKHFVRAALKSVILPLIVSAATAFVTAMVTLALNGVFTTAL